MKRLIKMKKKEIDKSKFKSINRQIDISENANEDPKKCIDAIWVTLTNAKNVLDMFIYDNISDRALFYAYYTGFVYKTNPRLFFSIMSQNKNKDELGKMFKKNMNDVHDMYRVDMNELYSSFCKKNNNKEVSKYEVINYILSNIKVSIETDLLYVAFMLGSIFAGLEEDEQRG